MGEREEVEKIKERRGERGIEGYRKK